MAFFTWVIDKILQHNKDKKKRDLELYEPRLRVYNEVMNILGVIVREEKVSHDELIKFYASVSDAKNLFGPEIKEYIKEIYEHACDLGR